MTDQKQPRPREFWIDEDWKIGACDEFRSCVYDREVKGIHVIEYSAVQRLRREIEVADKQIKIYIEGRKVQREADQAFRDRIDELEKVITELEKLNKENSDLVDAERNSFLELGAKFNDLKKEHDLYKNELTKRSQSLVYSRHDWVEAMNEIDKLKAANETLKEALGKIMSGSQAHLKQHGIKRDEWGRLVCAFEAVARAALGKKEEG